MGYVAPTWQNGGPPALNAKNMQDISDNLAYVSNHMVNPNLLDNWYFGNPVNQRNASFVEDSYGLDRWKGTYGVNDNGTMGFNSSGFAIQGLEDSVKNILDGMMLTASILYENGTLHSGTAVYTKTGNAHNFIDSGSIQFNNQADGNILLYAQSADQIKAVKLEIGSQQTIAHQENGVWVMNEIPDYGEQLRRCQRYFQRIVVPTSTTFTPWKDNQLYYQCDLPVQMRAEPSVTCGTFFIVNSSNESTVFSENFVTPTKESASVNSVIISVSKSQQNPVQTGKAGGAYVGLYYGNPGTRIIDCIADL